ncbi:alpha/beta hydrolase [Enemella dayhoffiae]|uniref:Alpha/beta hydrolase n=1 Tax=Enemella dayhoffiae TaxID=2016507 RepID=A0A255GWL9_9ACTN|nr:alpha/beta fold hydrolase [Enemella dayhoffiae]OYO19316.1 alpha/beta hydrolase [Enemella dayhoffiae]
MQLNRTLIGEGDGPLVVFCHGVFGQGKNWTSVARALATPSTGSGTPSTGSGVSCLLLDMPNHGRSEWSDSLDYRTMADQVADAIDAEPARNGAPVALVGHSMGGKIAMHLTLRHRELVERLCVADISPVAYGSMRGFHTFTRAMAGLDLAALSGREQAERHLAENGVDDPTVRSFLLQNLRRERVDGQTRWHWQPNLALIHEQMESLGGWVEPTEEPWPGPVLWVAGGDSDYVQPEYAARMRELFPAARLVTIKNAAHWVHADQPDIFTAVLRRFLELPGSR